MMLQGVHDCGLADSNTVDPELDFYAIEADSSLLKTQANLK